MKNQISIIERKLIPYSRPRESLKGKVPEYGLGNPHYLFISLILLWGFGPLCLQILDDTAGSVDQSVWLVVVLGLICFMLVASICWWLLEHFWKQMGMVPVTLLVLRFNTLTLWQQVIFYWASYALLVFTAIGCLAVIL